MMKRLKHFAVFCGVALIMLAAFPVFAQQSSGVDINRRPLVDFTALVIDRLQKKELILSDNFLIEVEGDLTKAGKLDRQKTRYIRTEGSQKMTDIAKSGIEAVNDSGFFRYLTELGANRINLTFSQNDQQILGIIYFDTESSNKAKSIVSILSFAAKLTKQKPNITDDEKVLIDAMSVSGNEKTVTIKFAVEKSVGQEIIQRKLSEEINKKLKRETGK